MLCSDVSAYERDRLPGPGELRDTRGDRGRDRRARGQGTTAELSKASRAEVQKALLMLKRGFLPLPHFQLPPRAAAVLEKFQARWNAATRT